MIIQQAAIEYLLTLLAFDRRGTRLCPREFALSGEYHVVRN